MGGMLLLFLLGLFTPYASSGYQVEAPCDSLIQLLHINCNPCSHQNLPGISYYTTDCEMSVRSLNRYPERRVDAA